MNGLHVATASPLGNTSGRHTFELPQPNSALPETQALEAVERSKQLAAHCAVDAFVRPEHFIIGIGALSNQILL